MKHEAWTRWLGDLSVERSRLELLDEYAAILLDEAVPAGMIAEADAPNIRERHVGDSLRAAPSLGPSGSVLDLGSGAGLPGLPLALVRPDLAFVLAERRRSRAAFLESVVDRLRPGNVVVHPGPAEKLPPDADVCLARAFAPPGRTWEVAAALLGRGGRLLYWAGRSFDPATDVPPGARAKVFASSGLAHGGAVVIMTRQ
ncbi:MAG TPA: RsmG family class I SAM-dependent methyltransferase [Actinomycetota bacterium]|nr:RsmG family class I SAM-dependent methyltransferase [Actinomycetota bacterium]